MNAVSYVLPFRPGELVLPLVLLAGFACAVIILVIVAIRINRK